MDGVFYETETQSQYEDFWGLLRELQGSKQKNGYEVGCKS